VVVVRTSPMVDVRAPNSEAAASSALSCVPLESSLAATRRPARLDRAPAFVPMLIYLFVGNMAGNHLPGLRLPQLPLDILHPAVIEHDDQGGAA
jgi:hypothetical protein